MPGLEGEPGAETGVRVLTQTAAHWQVFKDATLFFSRSTPNLAKVIPAMDHIDECLTDNSLNDDFEPSIRAANGLAKKTLNRYYSKTDQSELYRIAMSE